MRESSFFWHDYETWGARPSWDRPAQFAGVRTDLELNLIDEPLSFYCRPPRDRLPEPEAAIITGISPYRAQAEGLSEADFFARIHHELAKPGTCGLGYNSIRFDDEVTRYGLYRNFYDPYGREWRNDCGRWDIIDMLRLVRALRPEGIQWPQREDGATSFRLEDLTRVNGIAHEGAHDALADVLATIELAKLVRQAQPRLYDYVLRHKDKAAVAELLALGSHKPLLHISRMFPAERGAMAVVVPLLQDVRNKNAIHLCDLGQDPRPWLGLSAEAIRDQLYASKDELAQRGETRPGLKALHLNKCPVLAPLATLTQSAQAEWGIDLDACARHLELLKAETGLGAKLAQVFAPTEQLPNEDPEQALYQGFIDNADRAECNRVLRMGPDALAKARIPFHDQRLPELLFRYRAHNWPESLSAKEAEVWQALRHQNLHQGPLAPADYFAKLDELRTARPEHQALLGDLERWALELGVQKP